MTNDPPKITAVIRLIREEGNYFFGRIIRSKPSLIDGDAPTSGIPTMIASTGYSEDFQAGIDEHLHPGQLLEATLVSHVGRSTAAARFASFTILEGTDRLWMLSGDMSAVGPAQDAIASHESGTDGNIGLFDDDDRFVANVEVFRLDDHALKALYSGGTRKFDSLFREDYFDRPVKYVAFANDTSSPYTAFFATHSAEWARSIVDTLFEATASRNDHHYKTELQHDTFAMETPPEVLLVDNPPLEEATLPSLQWEPTEDETSATDTTAPDSTPDERVYPWSETTEVTFDGRGELLEAITREIVLPYCDQPDRAAKFDIPLPRVLLHGPPGTGKTHLAKAVAGDLGFPFVSLTGGDLLSKWINESAQQVNDLFHEAKDIAEEAGGSVVFVDEIDSVLRSRQERNQNAEDRKVVNEFLAHLEVIAEDAVLFIGATNVYETLDDAALSRFDREYFVGRPDAVTRREIFAVHLRERPSTLSNEELGTLADLTEGYTARDIKDVVVNAARTAAFEGDGDAITMADCQRALTSHSVELEPVDDERDGDRRQVR